MEKDLPDINSLKGVDFSGAYILIAGLGIGTGIGYYANSTIDGVLIGGAVGGLAGLIYSIYKC